MFSAFDEFLEQDSWASLNWPDMVRFYQALNVAALINGFTPVALGGFLDEQHQKQFGVSLKSNIRKLLEDRAETVQQFLRATSPQTSATA